MTPWWSSFGLSLLIGVPSGQDWARLASLSVLWCPLVPFDFIVAQSECANTWIVELDEAPVHHSQSNCAQYKTHAIAARFDVIETIPLLLPSVSQVQVGSVCSFFSLLFHLLSHYFHRCD